MYSQTAVRTAENCRFCWMCRHVCPVGLVTGREINTPRAKGLLVSMEKRGYRMDAGEAGAMFECLLCKSCANDCVTGFDPTVYIREARTWAAVEGLLPEAVEKLVERLKSTGSMYEEDDGGTEELIQKQNAHITFAGQGQPERLLYLGDCARHRANGVAVACMNLLERLGVEFQVMDVEPSSGFGLYDLLGDVDETRTQAMNCAKALLSSGAKQVIVLDPYDAEMMIHQYPAWGFDLPQAVTATAFVSELVSALPLKNRNMSVAIHDTSRLARDLEETEPVRILAQAAGCACREMFLNRRLTRCAGNELFAQYAPQIAEQIARQRWDDFLRTGADCLIAEDPQSFIVLERVQPDQSCLLDIFTLLEEACR